MVVEEFMTGREVSVLSFVDGKTIKIMSSAQDHKRAGAVSYTHLDLDAAGKVAGNGFYYLMGDIARLHSAMTAYALSLIHI